MIDGRHIQQQRLELDSRVSSVRPDVAPDDLLPHAGGAASYYFPVSRALSGQVEVLAVQYPGRQDRYAEPAIGNVENLAAAIFRELPPEDLDRTWLFGHSMGAAVAFEVARLMERELDRSPLGIILSGRRAVPVP